MTDWTGWAAGLFEGEGSIVLRRGRRAAQLALGSTDEDVVRRFHEVVGAGIIYGPVCKPKRKPMWYWACYHRRDVRRILDLLLPFLGRRRSARAAEALRRLPALDEAVAASNLVGRLAAARAKRSATHCKRGHPFTPENTYWYAGFRNCRECRRSAGREWGRARRVA